MPDRKVPYWDQEMAQYILDAVAAAPDSVMRSFDGRDLKLVKDINSSTLEQKLYLLGKLGKRFAVLVADREEKNNLSTIRALVEWSRKRIALLSGTFLRHWGAFVRADKELIQHLSRLSIDITPRTMYLLRDYNEIARSFDRVSRINISASAEHEANDILDHWILRVLSHNAQLLSYNNSRPKISRESICCIFYLSANKRRLVAPLDMSVHFGWKESLVRKYLNQLLEMDIVQKDYEVVGGVHIDLFQLTGYGNIILNKIREDIISR